MREREREITVNVFLSDRDNKREIGRGFERVMQRKRVIERERERARRESTVCKRSIEREQCVCNRVIEEERERM